MNLSEIRQEIDKIDPQIRDLLMRRMDQSAMIAQTKVDEGNTTIYRPERENEILKRLSHGVPAGRLSEYLAIVRKIMEASRMYQYDLLFDLIPGLFEPLAEGVSRSEDDTRVRVRFTCPDTPNSLSSVLAMIGDYGCNLEQLQMLGREAQANSAEFEVAFTANLADLRMQKLMFQLSKETRNFTILECF